MSEVPTIDFRKGRELKEGSEEWISLREQVYNALEEYGCFVALLDNDITKESLFNKLKQVKKLPIFSADSTDSDQTPLSKTKHAYLQVDNVFSPGVVENLSKILWPDDNIDPQFCDLVHRYAKGISEFDEMVRKMIFEKLGIYEKYWDEHKNSTSCAFSVIHYPVPKPDETHMRIGPHSDKRITTILSHYGATNGLQVMKKNGEWIDVQYSSSQSSVFLAADILSAITNGRLRPAWHRVLGDKERRVLGYAATAKEGYVLKVAEELVDEDHPLLYKTFEPDKFYKAVLAGKALSLDKFCGV